jgi:hypothetical protein
MAVLFGGEIGADLQKIGVTWMPSLDRKILTDLIES